MDAATGAPSPANPRTRPAASRNADAPRTRHMPTKPSRTATEKLLHAIKMTPRAGDGSAAAAAPESNPADDNVGRVERWRRMEEATEVVVVPPKPQKKAAPISRQPRGPPIRTLEVVRAKMVQVFGIDALKQTFTADVFFEFVIRGGAHDLDLTREGDGAPSTHFPADSLRPSARWYLNQVEFSNSVTNSRHSDTCVVTRGDDVHLRFRATGEFSEQLEFEDFPFDTQELTVKLIVHCVLGGFVAIEFAPPGFVDEWSRPPHGERSVPREEYNLEAAVHMPPRRIPQQHFKCDSFHLHNVWELCDHLSGSIGVHAGEFPQLRMTVLVKRKPHFYLWNIVVTSTRRPPSLTRGPRQAAAAASAKRLLRPHQAAAATASTYRLLRPPVHVAGWQAAFVSHAPPLPTPAHTVPLRTTPYYSVLLRVSVCASAPSTSDVLRGVRARADRH